MKRAVSSIKTLSRLLDEERRALLAGDVAAFGRIAAQKDAALTRLEAQLANRQALNPGGAGDQGLEDALGTLRAKASRGSALLTAALEGLNDARALMTALSEARHETYTADGSREQHRASTRRLERRA